MALLNRIIALFRRKTDVDSIIARRAERVSNRKRSAADRYIAIHTALGRGK